MKKGIGPYGLGAPKAVGKQITKDKIIKGAKEVGKFIISPGAYVAGKVIAQITGSKGTGATTPKRLPTLIKVPNGKEAIQEAAQEAALLGKPMMRGKKMGMKAEKRQLKRKQEKPVVKPKTGGLTKLKPAMPKADVNLQKLRPSKPKPQSKVAKPKKVKIKVKNNKTKIKIKN